MKNIVWGLVLIMYSGLLLAQKKIEGMDSILIGHVQAYESKLVRSCDTNSSVVNLSAKMEVSKFKLPKVISNKGVKSYNLKSKNRGVIFSFKKEQNNKIGVWLNEMEMHCFSIDTICKYSFQSYFLSKKSLEVYGKIKWDKFYKNFRIIFYFQKSDVFFDFDDEILKQN